jgi:hypothetical protein
MINFRQNSDHAGSNYYLKVANNMKRYFGLTKAEVSIQNKHSNTSDHRVIATMVDKKEISYRRSLGTKRQYVLAEFLSIALFLFKILFLQTIPYWNVSENCLNKRFVMQPYKYFNETSQK